MQQELHLFYRVQYQIIAHCMYTHKYFKMLENICLWYQMLLMVGNHTQPDSYSLTLSNIKI